MNELNTLDLLKSRLFDFTKIPPLQNKILTIDDNLILSRGNFMLLTGLPKVGKSLVSSIIIAAGLIEDDFFSIKVKKSPDKNIIAIFDTEQGQNDLYNSINRSIQLIENKTGATKTQIYYKLKSQLNVFSMREDDPEPIQKMIETYLQNNKSTGLIIIDGLLDLVYNYNDEREAKILINFLKRVTKQYDVGIICVLHTGKTTGTTIGHVGGFSDRYCQSNIEIVKENEQIIIKPKLLRSAQNFEPIALVRNNDTVYQVDYITSEKKK
jgi:KaiC/GvpD/RAD55 family RecA-like ATPase